MELQHVNVKVFVDGELSVDLYRFVEFFHEWIRDDVLDELLIDVVDYQHVPAGPAVMLIGHEADYAIDNAGHRFGLHYNGKAAIDGSNEDRLGQALAAALNACTLLEAHFAAEGLRFSRTEFELFINDRALAPNTPQTLAAAQPQIEAFLKTALNHDQFTLTHDSDPRRRFRLTVNTATPVDFDAVLNTLRT